MRRIWLALLALGVGVGLAVFALGRRVGNEVGNRAPNFKAIDLKTGNPVHFKDHYRGQVVLVNIWATWCAPCRQEMPSMEALYREFGAQGFKIAAVSVDEAEAAEILGFTTKLELTFDILHDRDGSVREAYGSLQFPESFLVDRKGVIVKKVAGAMDWNSDANRRLITELVGSRGAIAAKGDSGA